MSSRNPVWINGKYRISKRLGGGSFGDIYLGVTAANEKVAIKFEKHGARCPQLRHEYKVYREMLGCLGFGRVFFFGTHENYNVMVMELLGPSLEVSRKRQRRRQEARNLMRRCQHLAKTKNARELAVCGRQLGPCSVQSGRVPETREHAPLESSGRP
eukprot:scaffold334_cov241-Pinguiococcus_pyrenoidosus.AAC.23